MTTTTTTATQTSEAEIVEQIERVTRGHRSGNFRPKQQQDRAKKFEAILREHPDARLEICVDEKSGDRYGRAACRRGRCAKIGHTTFRYQLWAVWA